jgi:hypothetical protein
MNFEKQLDTLKGLLQSIQGGDSLLQFERYGNKGLFLEEPGIKLEDAEKFLLGFGENTNLKGILSPDISEKETEIPFSLHLEDLTLKSLSLSRMWEEEGYELALMIEWPENFHYEMSIPDLDIPFSFSFSNIRANIHLVRPNNNSAQEQVEVQISAEMKFNDADFDLSIDLPAQIFSASLKTEENQKDAHQKLLSDFLPHNSDNPTLEALDLTIALRMRRVLFHFTVSNIFDLEPLTLREVEFDILYDSFAPNKLSGSGWMDIEIEVGKPQPIDMLLLAERGHDRSWQIEGRTGPQGLNVGDLIDGLKKLYPGDDDDLPTLPDVIKNIEFSSLGLAYKKDSDSDSHSFTFEVLVTLHQSGADAGIDVHLRLEIDENHKKTLTGSIFLANKEFDLAFSSEKGDEDEEDIKAFIASYKDSYEIELKDVVSSITDSKEVAGLIPHLTIDLEGVHFAYVKEGKHSASLLGINLGSELTLKNLPLVGSVLKNIGLKNIQALYLTEGIDANQANAINALLPDYKLPEPSPSSSPTTVEKPTVLHKGFNFAGQLNLGKEQFFIVAGSGAADSPEGEQDLATSPQTEDQTSSPAPTDNTMWVDLQRNVGPVSLKRIGARYGDHRLWLLLSADLHMASFTLGLQGLGIGFKVGKWTDIEPTLSGVSLAYEAGPVEISGAFEKSGEQYLGAASIKTPSFSLSAFGAYGKTKGGDTSLFIYAMLTDPPLGGPSFFYVTGIAAGFGYNRDVRIPSLDDITKFPLVSAMLPEAKDAVEINPNPADPMETLDQISEGGWLPAAPGQNWLAVGVRFTSFEMVQSFALAIVKFGTRFEVDILGLSQLTIPGPDPETHKSPPDPIAYAEVALRATLVPDEGILRVDGKLTPASYILVKEARLTGGFAFYVWFDGDFVISFGGYHPDFDQGHYPDVPRLGIDFHIGSNLHITAKAYFALTPSAVMAGGSLAAVYQTGPLKAWFNAGADFLIKWKPFHYEAKIYVHIGASFTLHFVFFSVSITVELGADLTLWGPPLGGTARISYSIASFTIGFGAGRPAAPALSWLEFRDQFLPTGKDAKTEQDKNSALLSARVSEGLVKDLTQESDKEHEIAWVVNSGHVIIEVSTAVPATALEFNGKPLNILPEEHYSGPLHIGPMQEGGKNYSAPYDVKVEYFMDEKWVPYTKVKEKKVTGKSPKALWSDYNPLGQKKPLPQADSIIEQTLLGIRIWPISPPPDVTNRYNLKDLLFEEHEIEHVQMFESATDFDNQKLNRTIEVPAAPDLKKKAKLSLDVLKSAGIVNNDVMIELNHLGQTPGALNAQPRKRGLLKTEV